MKLETRNRIKHRQAISSFSLTFFLSSGSSSLPSCLMSSFFKSRACSSTQWMSKTVKTNWHSARNWPQISKICIHPHYEVHGVQAGLHQKSCFVLQFPSMTMILVTHFFVFFGSSAWIARGCKSASFRCSCSLQGLSCHDVPAAVNFLVTPKQFFWTKHILLRQDCMMIGGFIACK